MHISRFFSSFSIPFLFYLIYNKYNISDKKKQYWDRGWRNENKEIVSRNIYIAHIPYIQKRQYPYVPKNTQGINKNIKDNNIKYNCDTTH